MLFNIYVPLGTMKLVLIAARVHLFPYRTQKLSSLALTILGGKLPGKISRCQHYLMSAIFNCRHKHLNSCLFSSVGRAFVVNVIPEKLTKFKSHKHRSSVIIYKCLFSSVGSAFVANVIPEKLTKLKSYKHRFSVIIYKCLFSSVGRAFVTNVIPENLIKTV